MIVDGGATVFDSNAILLYLAEKTGKFLPPNTPANRGQLLSWLMFVATGVGPYSGQSVHFQHMAPEKLPYAINRYRFEAMRHYRILNDHLATRKYMVADTYTIVDMDVWGWARMMPFVLDRGALGRSCPTSSASSTRSRRARPPRLPSSSRIASPSRPTWTTRRAATCSATSPPRPERPGCQASA